MEMNFSSSSLPIFLSPLPAFLTMRLGNILINIKRQDVEIRHASNIYFSGITFHNSRPKWRGKSVMNFQPDVEVGQREIVTRKIMQNMSKELNDMCKFSAYTRVSSRFGKCSLPLSLRATRFPLFSMLFFPSLPSFFYPLSLPAENATQSDKQIYFRRSFAVRENRGLKERVTGCYYTIRENARTQIPFFAKIESPADFTWNKR